jgi:hypothetical protein
MRQALELALEALEYHTAQTRPIHQTNEAIVAIKEALAQPEQEPVAWWIPKAEQFCLPSSDGTRPFAKAWEPLYTTPPQRKWVGLTQDELNMIGDSMRTWNSWTITDVYFAIEAKLKEKNT